MTIREVAAKYQLTADTLRYYEKMRLILPSRKQSGFRDYDEEACKRIEFLKCMRSAGISIDFLIKYIALLEQGDHTVLQRIEILKEQKSILEQKQIDMSETLDRLNQKIKYYDQVLFTENSSKL